jgi:hypothetical protein
VKTKIPGIPEKAVILEVGLGKSFIKKVGWLKIQSYI